MFTDFEIPDHLSERLRIVKQPRELIAPEFVVYWMRSAVRHDENPALDVASLLADHYDVPLLVYHALSEHYRYASDRHHTFMLQGARGVQGKLEDAGYAYAFHLSTPEDRRPHLLDLADKAGLVVTEEMPTGPPHRFLCALTERSKAGVVAVDTSCVVPMQMVGKPYTRAFRFRSATEGLYAERLTRSWPDTPPAKLKYDLLKLPFEPIDFSISEIGELVSRCEIDHSVGPVVDTVGGSTAGYERWEKFYREGLKGYARKRNDALLGGVSRMSPYLHYGMVSPFRIAREAADLDGKGPEKFLDELLIWRELAYVFCHFQPDHNQWQALPEWAQETLEKHAGDKRSQLYSWEELARGQTDDEFWNAAQKSLLMQGELHNNVRMTWGKAILNWTATPQAALRMIVDLNHRYALDGRDPASYGGILWCLGQFDRPFEPEKPVFGTVRPRSTRSHAKRLNVEDYLEKVTTPRFKSPKSVAVIGAGISGLFAARTLADHGLQVTLFEKSRGRGGRMSTRRASDEMHFDHGAQYFTARDARFRRYIEAWKKQGLIAHWPNPDDSEPEHSIVVIRDGGIEKESNSQERFVAVPTMNSICRHLSNGLNIRTQTRVDKIELDAGQHQMWDEQGISLGMFDAVVSSAPAEQSAHLLKAYPSLVEQFADLKMSRCWAAMVSLEKPISDQWVGAFIHNSFLTWAARNSTKPGRNATVENVVIHAGPEWTEQHWEDPSDDVAHAMLAEFWRATGCSAQQPLHLQGHRWGFALATIPAEAQCFFDAQLKIGACGDWANGSRVEGAFLSGLAIAGRVLSTLQPGRAESNFSTPASQQQLF